MDEDEASHSRVSKNDKIVTKSTKFSHKLTTFARYVTPRPIVLWRRYSNRRKQKRISKKIDEKLKKDDRNYHEILVIGDQHSGKSSILKQMKILFGDGFSDVERQKFIKIIQKNLRDAILSVVAKTPSDQFDTDIQENINFIERCCFKCENREHFFSCVEAVCHTPALQAALNSTNANNLIAITKYFIGRIEQLKSNHYLPTNEDILHCYEPTKTAVEMKFEGKRLHYKMYEIPNLKYDKRIWRQIVEGISSIVFVIPCNAFLDFKNKKTNSLLTTIEELDKFQKNAWLPRHFRYIIFLNKMDLFRERILKGCANLEQCFPGFSVDKSAEVTNEVLIFQVEKFLFSKFSNLILSNEKAWHNWYTHFTCATDSGNMAEVYQACEDAFASSNKCTIRVG